MNDHEPIHVIRQSQAEPRARTRAEAKIIVQSSEAKAYDQTASPALMKLHLSETFSGISMANHRSGLWRFYAMINLPASSACNDSAGNWAGVRAVSCFKVQKSWRTARSRRHGLLCRDRGQVIFRGCAARAVLKVSLEKAPMDGWNIGSNDVAAIIDTWSHGREPAESPLRLGSFEVALFESFFGLERESQVG
jgi:hypothetical protein